jgi:hypothetical protein
MAAAALLDPLSVGQTDQALWAGASRARSSTRGGPRHEHADNDRSRSPDVAPGRARTHGGHDRPNDGIAGKDLDEEVDALGACAFGDSKLRGPCVKKNRKLSGSSRWEPTRGT